MTQIIKVTISPTGETKVQTKGFVGASCREASKFMEQALGQRAHEQLTGEFHCTHQVQQSHQQQA